MESPSGCWNQAFVLVVGIIIGVVIAPHVTILQAVAGGVIFLLVWLVLLGAINGLAKLSE
jgi:hypothetical protein